MLIRASSEEDAAGSSLARTPQQSARPLSTLGAALMVLLSVAVRLINLHSPLADYFGFRQTQTAITVWVMAKEGISFLHYQTPVLGAPWRVPFEFPTYQAAAALLAHSGLDLDVACRLTSLFFFYLSALLVYRLCLLFTSSAALSWWTLGFYLWCPFMIVWSRACLIDYTSVFFTLSYLYFLLRWMRSARHTGLLILALFFGCLGYLTKITTMFTIYPMLAFAVWQHMRLVRGSKEQGGVTGAERVDIVFLVSLAMALILPLVVGIVWVHYTDQVKAQTPCTDWLTSASLKTWNYGTLAQRLQISCWLKDGKRLVFLMVMPPVVAGLWKARHAPLEERAWFWLSLAAIALPIMVLFNLYYVHDYYYIALTPFIASAGGYGLYTLWQGMPKSAVWLRPAVALFSLVSLAWSARYMLKIYTVHYDAYVCRVGAAIQAATPEGSGVVIEGYDWDASLLYYARRKGLMIVSRMSAAPPDVHVGYTTYVCVNTQPRFLAHWKYHALVGTVNEKGSVTEIYHVSETPL